MERSSSRRQVRGTKRACTQETEDEICKEPKATASKRGRGRGRGKVATSRSTSSCNSTPAKKEQTPDPSPRPPGRPKASSGTLGVKMSLPAKKKVNTPKKRQSKASPSPGKKLKIIHKILTKSVEDEKAEDDVEVIASSEAESEVEIESRHVQSTMEGEKDYRKRPRSLRFPDESDDDDGKEENLEPSTSTQNTSKMHLIVQDPNCFNVEGKKNKDWWAEDPYREKALIEMWHETPCLYKTSAKEHHTTEDRPAIMRRFATILEIPPHVIETRLQSLRNDYQRMFRAAPSGGEPVGKTIRQKELLRTLWFLREHIKKSPSISSYTSQIKREPGEEEESEEENGLKGRELDLSRRSNEEDEEDLQSNAEENINPSDVSHTPQRLNKYILTESEEGTGDHQDDFTPERRSKRVTPESKKTSDKSKIKRSKQSTLDFATSTPSNEKKVTKKKTVAVNSTNSASPAAIKGKGRVIGEVIAISPIQLGSKKTPLKKKQVKSVQNKPTAKKIKTEGSSESKENKKTAPTKPNALERKRAMADASTSSETKEGAPYDVQNQQKWFKNHGPAFRKSEDAKKKAEKKTDPMQSYLDRKADQMDTFNAGLRSLINPPNATPVQITTVPKPEAPPTAEQLWLNSILPQLMRMSEETRDEYMSHCTSLAFKAVRGKWP